MIINEKNMAKQTCLEKVGIEKRHDTIVKNDYNIEDQYSQLHKDALSDGDTLGKGSGHGGHTHYVPDCNKPSSMMDYSNFDTESSNIGGSYDINGRNGVVGRNFLKTISIYNEENQYGPNLIDTTANEQDGQIIIK